MFSRVEAPGKRVETVSAMENNAPSSTLLIGHQKIVA